MEEWRAVAGEDVVSRASLVSLAKRAFCLLLTPKVGALLTWWL
jgi:hypothetical protein